MFKEKISFLWSYLSDNCLGRVNVDKAEFPEYARRLAEFCSLCKERNVSYMNREGYAPEWFASSHLYAIGKTNPWFNTSEVAKLIADPLQALGGRSPDAQRRLRRGSSCPPGELCRRTGFTGLRLDARGLSPSSHPAAAEFILRNIQGTLILGKNPIMK